MSTQHTPEPLSQMPVVTVEQIVMFRDAAMAVEKQRDTYAADVAILEQKIVQAEQRRDELLAALKLVHPGPHRD